MTVTAKKRVPIDHYRELPLDEEKRWFKKLCASYSESHAVATFVHNSKMVDVKITAKEV